MTFEGKTVVAMRWSLVVCAGACCVVLGGALSGCSKGPPEGIVRGTVTLDGKPLESGDIRVSAIDGRARTAGAQIVNGKFEFRAPIAKFRVEIESNVLPGSQKPDPNKKVDKYAAAQDAAPISLVPAKYNRNSTLELDVQPGVQEKNFDLQSK